MPIGILYMLKNYKKFIKKPEMPLVNIYTANDLQNICYLLTKQRTETLQSLSFAFITLPNNLQFYAHNAVLPLLFGGVICLHVLGRGRL